MSKKRPFILPSLPLITLQRSKCNNVERLQIRYEKEDNRTGNKFCACSVNESYEHSERVKYA